MFIYTSFCEIKFNTTICKQITYKSQHFKDLGSLCSRVVEVVSWRVSDLNVCTLLDSSQIIFLHAAVGNVIIKTTQKWRVPLNSICMCTYVQVWFPFFFFFNQCYALQRNNEVLVTTDITGISCYPHRYTDPVLCILDWLQWVTCLP